MSSFLLISLLTLSSQVLGLKLIDILPNGNDFNTDSDNSDSTSIKNVVGLLIDQVMDKQAPDPAVVPANTPTLYPALIKQPPNQVAFSPTPIPIKVPIVPTEPKITTTPTIERYECSLEEKEYQLKMYWKKGNND